MNLNIKKFAELTGVSVRTLRYYDEIGLLPPDRTDEQTGYRFYGDRAFLRMQEILFYRELDFPLKEIREILSSPNYDKQKALHGQKQLLLLKKQRLETILRAIERAEKGEPTDMSAFDTNDLEKAKEVYRDEAERRWGKTDAYQEHRRKTAGYTKEAWNNVAAGLDAVFAEFAEARAAGIRPTDTPALALARKLQDFLTETQYTCTDEILRCLGEMYTGDDRFRASIDRHGEGTAEFVNAAIAGYCDAKKA